ncbi:hypothetical protein [Afipia broomeae]|uniref:Uncharacterized protein n=1 Tax=Afipia broomeae ATCC 49717 TaxID=883078 RepID=K8P8Z7_9BRAD|nr:hypothetical protein [Afipia broomeae]EKS34818.1 hypothetical protein HMPREF9695_04728 [Afipia broomeae ATCC 49717]
MRAYRLGRILLAYVCALFAASLAIAIFHFVMIMLVEPKTSSKVLLFILPATLGLTPFVLLFTIIPGLIVAISAELAGLRSSVAYISIGVGVALLCLGVVVGWDVINLLIYPASGAVAGYVYWLVAGRNSVPYGY